MAIQSRQLELPELLGELNELEKTILPRVAQISLNRAVFDGRERLRQEAKQRFMKVSNFTLNQFLYEKPQQVGKNLEASVFIRPRIPNGNAPSKYLAPHIYGGSAYRTRFQRLLESADTYIGRNSTPILTKDEIMTPVLSNTLVRKSKFGGMSRGQYSAIANQMRGNSKPPNNRYFYVGDNISQKSPGLKKGIYLRKNKKISLVMVQNPTPSFVAKFNFFNYTEDEVTICSGYLQRFGGDASFGKKHKIQNLWQIYWMSPYKETIVLDADMLFLNDYSTVHFLTC